MDATISSLLGVLIGGSIGLLTPFVSNIIDKRRRKVALKSELIYSVSLYHGILKDHLITINYLSYSNRSVVLSGNVNKLLTDIDRYKNKVEDSYTRLIEVEAKLISLTSEITDYYGKEVHRSVISLMKPILEDNSNLNKIHLFNYSELNIDELNAASMQILNLLDIKQHDLQSTCDNLVKEVNAILKF